MTSIARQVRPDTPSNLSRGVFFFGDSHMLRNWDINDTAHTSTYRANGFFTWANALLGGVYFPTGVVADPGKQSTYLNINYLDQMRADPSQLIVYLTGTNDCYNAGAGVGSWDVEITKAAWITFWEAARQQGKTVLHCTIPPDDIANFDYKAQHTLNEWLIDQGIIRDNVIVADIASVMTDPTSATGDSKSGYLEDSVHFSKIGAYWAGKEVARVLANYAPIANSLVYSVASTGTDTDSTRKFVSGGLGLGTSGTHTAFAGTTGDVPGTGSGDLWNISTAGAGVTAIASTIAAHSKAGNYWELDITTDAADQSVAVQPNDTNWEEIFSVGDYVVWELEVTTISNTTGMGSLWLRMGILDNGTTYYYDSLYPIDTTTPFPEDGTFVFRTPPHQIKSLTNLNFTTTALNAKVAGIGNCAYRIARASIRKITMPDSTPVLS